MTKQIALAGAIASTLVLAPSARAQTGGYVVTLGKDTVQVEQFTRTRDRVEGTVVYRAPAARVVKYNLTLDAAGNPVHYEQSIYKPDGSKVDANVSNTTMSFTHDSVFIDTWKGDQPTNVRYATPFAAMPILGGAFSVPFQYSYMTYELAYAQARKLATATGDSHWYLVNPIPQMKAPQTGRVWLVGKDSLEADYFGLARSGYKFDAAGHILRTDWTKTTYGYHGARVKSVNVDGIARAWAAQEASGTAFGIYSPRDSGTTNMGGASLWIDYSRPAMRGRTVWGNLVPNDVVWRLGADFATQLKTDVDIEIGDALIPAGKYSLWMMLSETAPVLIVNRQSGQFGTQYDPRQDLVRIPLRRVPTKAPVERLALSFHDDAFWIAWSDAAFTAPVHKH